ncbi:post-transcriptional regulator [Halobacillus mangrovi]|uniref:Post-transcriptional regulator n=1 Tax=Halobacillus mangrovi TaxID=402384 RepID=A0A1W5ZUG9_9BACI|nr:post-transcriptional regulator [Halobacillus mangrovi]ARI76956.1 hypothetical protein HM131_08920 [Halobacillus mangrovi]
MEEEKTVSQWKKHVDPVLIIKTDELRLLGYVTTKNEVWECLRAKVWEGNPEKRLYEIVQDVLHLKSHTYESFVNHEENDDLEAIEDVNSGYNE